MIVKSGNMTEMRLKESRIIERGEKENFIDGKDETYRKL